jgi:hypothetical protein
MSDLYGFIIARHVMSEKTNYYWNNCVKLIRTFYPERKIIIIDDNSDYNFVKSVFDYKDLEVIQSEFKGRGELLPYYYFLKYKFFKNAVIIHDSVFIHKKINFENLIGLDVMPLWFFNKDNENLDNSRRLVKNLKNYLYIDSKIVDDNLLFRQSNNWKGCFGVQSFINLHFLEKIEEKYNISNLISVVTCRKDRCCLERIMGCIFSTESPTLLTKYSLLGNIMSYEKWGYSYDQYINDLKKGTIIRPVIKVWTGR